MRKELYKPSFRPPFLSLIICLSLLSVLDLHAQVAYATGLLRQVQNLPAKERERPPAPSYLVSLQVENASLAQVLDKIEAQTSLVFVYSNDDIKAAQKISLTVKDNKLDDVLQMLLLPLDIRYEFISNKIILKHNGAVTGGGQQQESISTGRVVDNNGQPIAGVNIRVKGLSIGTVSSGDGA